MSGRARLRAGATVLLPEGPRLVVEWGASGVTLRDAAGALETVPLAELIVREATEGEEPQTIHAALAPRWDALSAEARMVALRRLEVVLTVITGYRRGFAALAEPDEPQPMFDPRKMSLTQRAASMARQLGAENAVNRERLQRVRAGELKTGPHIGKTTVLNWVRAYERDGLWGLVDKRAARSARGITDLDKKFRELAGSELARFDGDVSTVRIEEVWRRVQVRAAQQGVELSVSPRRARQYLSWSLREKGRGTRAQRTRSLRDSAGFSHYPALRPGQVVAIDATRSDVLVWDDLHERSYSVEILTALDVATRVVLGLRVVPKSATAIDAALLLYDVLRPFALNVEGTTVSDWRWCGIPEAIDFCCEHAHAPDEGQTDRAADEAPASLQGSHSIPGLMPDAIRCDHGSIFVGAHFTNLLAEMGIDLMLSRGRRPTDNAHVERFHETLQDVLQRIGGYKGRSPYERGRLVGKSRDDADRPLLTAGELERYLRTWVALEYHRSRHEGLVLAGAPTARLTPLEMYDALLKVTGRIDVPQRPDLVYQFLPIKWGTIQHDGVEFANLTYDDPILDDFRQVLPGAFGRADRKAPFYYDPRDVSRVWFPHPATGQVYPINWRGAWRVNAPMTDKVLDEVRARIRRRGGNTALGRRTATEQVIRELHTLETVGKPLADQALMAAAAVRVDASRRDHLEAQLAAYSTARRGEAIEQVPLKQTTPEPLAPPSSSTSEVTASWDNDPDEDNEPEDTNVIHLATAWAHLRDIARTSAAAEESW